MATDGTTWTQDDVDWNTRSNKPFCEQHNIAQCEKKFLDKDTPPPLHVCMGEDDTACAIHQICWSSSIPLNASHLPCWQSAWYGNQRARENQLVAHTFEWQQGWSRFRGGIGMLWNCQWSKNKGDQMDLYQCQESLTCAHTGTHCDSVLGTTSSWTLHEKLILWWWNDLGWHGRNWWQCDIGLGRHWSWEWWCFGYNTILCYEHYIQSWLIWDLENMNSFNFGTGKLLEIIIQHYTTNHDVFHKFKDMSMLKHSITSLILSALVFEIIHPSNCIWVGKSATLYFQLMTKGWTPIIWCIVMCCPPRFYKSIYCSVNLFNRWKSAKNQYQNKYKLVSASQPHTLYA